MNLLFIHGNFPAQFANIAPEMAKRLRANVVFLTLAENAQNIELPGVKVIRFALHRDVGEATHQYLKSAEESVLKAQAVLRSLHQLVENGFTPDVIICHGGMGFGLYAKAYLPNVKLVSYMEWYFTIENSGPLFANSTLDDHLRLQTRNVPLLQEMVEADEIVCPTQWQASQFPEMFRSKIKIIFDGVNRDFFKPALPEVPFELQAEFLAEPLCFGANDLILSYGTRGMEPLRGFPEFMRAAAVAQQRFPQLHVVVFGRDRTAYSYVNDQFEGSWKTALLNELEDQLDPDRLHFTGLLNYGTLVRLFRRSDLHCYFTRPYVVSWGVFQAASCGANLLVNEFSGMAEVFSARPTNPTVNLDKQVSVTDGVIRGLELRCENREELLGKVPQSSLNPGLELQTCLDQWQALLSGLTR